MALFSINTWRYFSRNKYGVFFEIHGDDFLEIHGDVFQEIHRIYLYRYAQWYSNFDYNLVFKNQLKS